VAVTSAGPCANLHLTQSDNHARIPPLSCFTGRMPFLPPNQQHQSTNINLPLGTAMPMDNVNSTITMVIVLKYNGGMYVALAM